MALCITRASVRWAIEAEWQGSALALHGAGSVFRFDRSPPDLMDMCGPVIERLTTGAIACCNDTLAMLESMSTSCESIRADDVAHRFVVSH